MGALKGLLVLVGVFAVTVAAVMLLEFLEGQYQETGSIVFLGVLATALAVFFAWLGHNGGFD